jgi:hypothetical protein
MLEQREAPMRENEAKRPPQADAGVRDEPVRQERTGSREHATREAVRKDQRSVAEMMKPGAPPDPGMEEDYGKRSGEVPSEEPGNRAKGPPAT